MVGVALDVLALRVKTPQRKQLQTACVRESAIVRRAPVPAFAERHGGQCRQCELVNAAVIILPEQSEITVAAEFAVDNAPVHELQRSGRIQHCPVRLYLGLAEAEVP